MTKHVAGRAAQLILGAALAVTVGVLPVAAETIKFWTTETQPDRLAKQQKMAEEFKAKTGVTVDVIPVEESDLGTRVTAAFAAGDLPDVIYHPLSYALPWTQAGILDPSAATDVIDALGAKTFSQGPLDMVKTEGEYAAVPVDGWTQLVLYRKSIFEKAGLQPPTNYANMEAAAKKLNTPPSMYATVFPTKVDEAFMSQVLEQVFLANGVSPVDKAGFKPLDEAKTVQVLNFYKDMVKASPPGELYWKQSRELYFAGKAAFIVWSPFILDELAGLRNSAPPMINSDPTSLALAHDTGIVASMAGPSNPAGASWASINYFGITTDADTQAAESFVKFSMSDGYTQTLSIAPEGKFPIRRGTKADPEAYVKAWATLPVGVDRKEPLNKLYPQAEINKIVSGLDSAKRWGVGDGQLALASKMINSGVINRLVREYIDGQRDAKATVAEMNKELAKIH